MGYIKIEEDNMVNGEGIRTVLWFAGCHWHCKGCHNPETWDPERGKQITGETITYILETLHRSYVQGLTLSGGDPFYPTNRESLLVIAKACKEAYPEKDIWCWTGYNFEDIKDDPATKYIDVMVDGNFSMIQRIEDLKRGDAEELLKYRGSSNQRVIDVQRTLVEGRIIEHA